MWNIDKFFSLFTVLWTSINLDSNTSLEASITKLTFYHIICFLLSKDAFAPNLAEFGPVTRARTTNLALNRSRIEILQVRKKLQNRQKLMTFWIDLNLWHPESWKLNFQNRSTFTIQTADFKFVGITQIWSQLFE